MDRSFEITVRFEQVAKGQWYPIVKIIFHLPSGYKVRLPLLLDTGADGLVLHPKYESMFLNLVPTTYDGYR